MIICLRIMIRPLGAPCLLAMPGAHDGEKEVGEVLVFVYQDVAKILEALKNRVVKMTGENPEIISEAEQSTLVQDSLREDLLDGTRVGLAARFFHDLAN